ncbi:MAG: hypothetical protein ACI835_005756 [Planctomycetota bacterium]
MCGDKPGSVTSHHTASIGTKILLIGGSRFSTGASSDTVDIYDAATDIWTTATLWMVRGIHTTAIAGTKLLIAGPLDATASAVVDVYDSTTDSWSVAMLAAPRFGHTGASTGRYAVFAGGWRGSAPQTIVDVYDSVTDSWSVTHLSQPAGAHATGAIGDKVIFAGGSNQGWSDLVEIYDCGTDTWSQARLSRPRKVSSIHTIGSKVIFVGGGNAIDIYDDSVGSWSHVQTSGLISGLQQAVAGDKLIIPNLVALPYTGWPLEFMPVADVYDASADVWYQTEFFRPREGVASASVGELALFAGGWHPFLGATDRVDIYEELGVEYCSATANSTGRPAEIFATGKRRVPSDSLVLRSGPIPDDVPVTFFYGPNQAQLAFGNGFLCVGQPRYTVAPPTRALNRVAGVRVPTRLWAHVPGSLNFQCIFRDTAAGGANFNSSVAYQIEFVP